MALIAIEETCSGEANKNENSIMKILTTMYRNQKTKAFKTIRAVD